MKVVLSKIGPEDFLSQHCATTAKTNICETWKWGPTRSFGKPQIVLEVPYYSLLEHNSLISHSWLENEPFFIKIYETFSFQQRWWFFQIQTSPLGKRCQKKSPKGRIPPVSRKLSQKKIAFPNQKKTSNIPTKWAPTSCKWSYNPYKWPCKWVIGVITPFKTGRGPPCTKKKTKNIPTNIHHHLHFANTFH